MTPAKRTGGTAVVTGASSGIGAAYADRLAARGHALLLVARRGERLQTLASDLNRDHGVEVETLVADLTDPVELAKLEQRLIEQPVDLLVNNAGAGGLGPSAQVGADKLDALIRLNVLAVTRLSLAALTGFRSRNAGTLINIGSVIAFSNREGGGAYSGTKAYVLSFTRSLALEYASTPIRVQVVMPGPVRTEFFAAQSLPDTIFPAEMYISALDLADAALAGLDLGEVVTTPTLNPHKLWGDIERAQAAYLSATAGGKVADRYGGAVEII